MSKVVGIKLTDAEYASWESAAKSAGLTVPMWIRSQVKVNPPTAKVNPSQEPTAKAAPKVPEGHSLKCTCKKCNEARGWRG